MIKELEADLARHKRMSLEEYKKLLSREEGIEGLEDYDEEED